MKPDLFWIPCTWRGRLAVATRPRGGDWLEDEVIGLRNAGLDIIVSLLEEDEARQLGLENERAVSESNGLQFLSFPIPDRGVPSSTEAAAKLVLDLTSALTAGRNVAVHCRQGVGRSGLLAAAVLMTAGTGARQAVEAVTQARGIGIPETTGQMQWLNRFHSEGLALAS
jgi:protein-tyrosine phosphatase